MVITQIMLLTVKSAYFNDNLISNAVETSSYI